MWRAVSKGIGIDISSLKHTISQHVQEDFVQERIVKAMLDDGYPALTKEQFMDNLSDQMKEEVMCEVDSVYATQDYINYRIHVYTNDLLCHATNVRTEWEGRDLHIQFVPGHFEHLSAPAKFKSCANFLQVPMECTHKPTVEKMEIPVYKKEEICPEVAKELTETMEQTSIGSKIKSWLSTAFTSTVNFFAENPIVGALFSLAAGLFTFLGITIPFLNGDVEKDGLIMRFTNATRSVYYAQKGTEGIFTAFKGTIDALYRDWETDRKSTRLNSSHSGESRMPSSA